MLHYRANTNTRKGCNMEKTRALLNAARAQLEERAEHWNNVALAAAARSAYSCDEDGAARRQDEFEELIYKIDEILDDLPEDE